MKSSILTIVTLLTGLLSVAPRPSCAAEADESSVPKMIEEEARAFVAAYDQGDAEAVAQLWTEDAEYMLGTNTVKGRDAIQRMYEDHFRSHPGSKMEIHIESVRMLAPTVAVERGTASVHDSPQGPPSTSAYTAVHLNQDGTWRMASVRESDVVAEGSDQSLQDLAWMVGDWVSPGHDASIAIHFEWVAGKSFLRGETTIGGSGAESSESAGIQMIGLDPIRGQIVSWFFHPGGGHGHGTWTKDGSRWRVRTLGATAEGQVTSSINVLYQAHPDTISWQSVDRSIDGQSLSDTPEIVLERVTSEPATSN